MQIKIAKNSGLALLSLIILAALFIVLIAGLAYLVFKVKRWSDKMGNGGNGGNLTEQVESYDAQEGAALPQGAIAVPVASTNAGTVLRFTVEQSTNLVEWLPLTNFLCAPDDFWQEWRMPIDTTEPQRFFRIGAEQP